MTPPAHTRLSLLHLLFLLLGATRGHTPTPPPQPPPRAAGAPLNPVLSPAGVTGHDVKVLLTGADWTGAYIQVNLEASWNRANHMFKHLEGTISSGMPPSLHICVAVLAADSVPLACGVNGGVECVRCEDPGADFWGRGTLTFHFVNPHRRRSSETATRTLAGDPGPATDATFTLPHHQAPVTEGEFEVTAWIADPIAGKYSAEWMEYHRELLLVLSDDTASRSVAAFLVYARSVLVFRDGQLASPHVFGIEQEAVAKTSSSPSSLAVTDVVQVPVVTSATASGSVYDVPVSSKSNLTELATSFGRLHGTCKLMEHEAYRYPYYSALLSPAL